MKNLFLIFTLCSFYISCGQSQKNELTTSQWNNIKFSGVSKLSLESTDGNIQEMQNLLGPASIQEVGAEIGELHRTFNYPNGLSIAFGGLSKNQSPEITNITANSVTIKGVTVHVNDPVNKLGSNVIVDTAEDQSKSFVFTQYDYDCCFLVLEIDQVTSRIKEIYYFVQT